MATKVEMMILKEKGITALAFETNNEEGLAILDAINMAVLGDQKKDGGFVNSRRFVVHIQTPEVKSDGQ